MKQKMMVLSTTLSLVLLSGCGGGATTDTAEINKQPHNTSKLNRQISTKKDWTWNVDVRVTDNALYGNFYDGFPDEIKHNQYFIDSDNDITTGFTGTNGWEINGADYIIEDNQLYKSLSNTSWEWKYIGEFEGFKYSNIPQGEPSDPKKQIIMSSPDFDFNSIFKSNRFKVMMELYDENWVVDYSTVTGIDVEAYNLKEEISRDIKNRYKDIDDNLLPNEDQITLTHLSDDIIISRALVRNYNNSDVNNKFAKHILISYYKIVDDSVEFQSDLFYDFVGYKELLSINVSLKNDTTLIAIAKYSYAKIDKEYHYIIDLNVKNSKKTFTKDEFEKQNVFMIPIDKKLISLTKKCWIEPSFEGGSKHPVTKCEDY